MIGRVMLRECHAWRDHLALLVVMCLMGLWGWEGDCKDLLVRI